MQYKNYKLLIIPVPNDQDGEHSGDNQPCYSCAQYDQDDSFRKSFALENARNGLQVFVIHQNKEQDKTGQHPDKSRNLYAEKRRDRKSVV